MSNWNNKVFDNSKFYVKLEAFSSLSLLPSELFYTNISLNFHPKHYSKYRCSSKIKMTNSRIVFAPVWKNYFESSSEF